MTFLNRLSSSSDEEEEELSSSEEDSPESLFAGAGGLVATLFWLFGAHAPPGI